ncbi:MAG: dTDP-4-dehydrorhamnose reductase [Candidatus Kapaibacteriales bacterium]
MRILLIGRGGQLGGEFERFFYDKKVEFVSVDLPEFDVSDLSIVIATFKSYKPNYIINCSAYNFVDKAEEDRWNAFRVNAIGPQNLAIAAKKFDAFLVHFSTNYVFDGRKNFAYTEQDKPNPINFYGISKYLGEEAIQKQTENFLILRTSWLYGKGQQNFIAKFTKWASKTDKIYISTDEMGTPTSTRTVVETTMLAIENNIKGLFHLVNSGYCSRYDWANRIASVLNLDCDIFPARMDKFPSKAIRPIYGVLSNELISKTLNITLTSWETELKEYLTTKKDYFAELNY